MSKGLSVNNNDSVVKLHEGPLFKKGHVNKAWKQRWFVLSDELRLRWYENHTKCSEAEMIGAVSKNVKGEIDLRTVESIQVTFPDKLIKSSQSDLPKYITIKKASSDTKNSQYYLIHLASTLPTLAHKVKIYILSTTSLTDFEKWLSTFHQYVYGEEVYGSYGSKQGKVRQAFKKRYFVLNKSNQIKYYNNDKLETLHGAIDLTDIHVFHTDGIENDKAPSGDFLIELNGKKRVWTLSFDTDKILSEWCDALQSVGLIYAKRDGDSFKRKDDPADDDEKKADTDPPQSKTMTVVSVVETMQFTVHVDGIGLYRDVELTNEVFGLNGFEKGTVFTGKYATEDAKIVQVKDDLFCSVMEVEAMAQEQTVGLPRPPNSDKLQAEPETNRVISHLNI